MNSEESSFRQMFEFPQGHDSRHRKYILKNRHNRRQLGDPKSKETFYDIVQKAKHVALFAQNLKHRIAENHSLNAHTLKTNELEYLQQEGHAQESRVLFGHENKILMVVDILFIAVMLTFLWMNTYQIIFGEVEGREVINGVALAAYFSHILLFNLTEYKNTRQELVTDRNELLEIYLSRKLIQDLLALIAMTIQLTPFSDNQDHGWLFVGIRMVALVVYLELSEVCDKVEDQLSVTVQTQTLISLFKLLFKIFIFLHFLSVILNLMVRLQHSKGRYDTWLDNSGMDHNSNFQKYILGWYWGSTILSTVGFGQIVPGNNLQRFVISVVQVLCCMIFGYFVNVIGELIKMRNEPQAKYEKDMRSLNRILGLLNTSSDTKHKIRNHYFNKHIIQQIHDPNQEKEILSTLTPSLKTTLLEENNTRFLKASPLAEKFTQKTLTQLSQLLTRVIMAPEQKLYSRQTKDRKLWFIEEGIVDEFTDMFKESTLRKKISSYDQKDSTVGWISFLTQTAYQTLAKAKNFTIAYELDSQNFMNLIRTNESEYRKLLQMKQVMVEKGRKFIPKCLSCDRYTHNVVNCPRIHFVRKDICKLISQQNNLRQYQGEVKTKRKYQRSWIKCNWKPVFGNMEMEKDVNILTENEHERMENATMENFIKLMRDQRVSTRQLGRRPSYVGTHKQIKLEEPAIAQKPLSKARDSLERSSYSSDNALEEVQDEEEGEYFELVFFNGENGDFMPQHDVEEVLTCHRKHTRRMLKDRINKVRLV